MASLPSFYRGDTKTYNVAFKKNGVGIDVSSQNLTLTLKVRKDQADVDAAFNKTITFPIDANSAAGVGSFVLTSTDTAGITPGVYFYDFQLVNPLVSPVIVTTLASGKVEVITDITIAAT
jgi:imidazole glycerol phosphate synthase subunit HisF